MNKPVRGCPVKLVEVYVPFSVVLVTFAVPLDAHPSGQAVSVNRNVASLLDVDPLSGPDADCPFWMTATVPLSEDPVLGLISQVIVPGPSWSKNVPRQVPDHSVGVGAVSVGVGAVSDGPPPQAALSSATATISRARRNAVETKRLRTGISVNQPPR